MSAKSQRLRAALDRPELLVIPGGFSPLHARMCDRLGFDAFFMSGSQVGAYLYAVPDVGLLSMRDMVEATRRLATGSEIPILADADTGYGNALNVRQTVQEYIRAGAAGLHIEDQEFPKRSGTAAGRRCISLDEALGKYRAAVDAAREPICLPRTSARSIWGRQSSGTPRGQEEIGSVPSGEDQRRPKGSPMVVRVHEGDTIEVARDALCLDVIDAIFSTRAIRQLRPDPIADDVLWAILDAAIRGPSSGNVQRWGWIVIRDRSTKETIARWYEDAWSGLRPGRRARLRAAAARVLPVRASPAPDPPQDPNLAAGEHLARHIADAPVWVIAAQRGVNGEPTLVDGADIYGAIQNLMLAARKHGVGSTLTMLHRQRERDVRRLLGLPDDVCTVALIPLGYPDGQAFSRPHRHPVETVTHWERWGRYRQRPETPRDHRHDHVASTIASAR